MFHRDQAHDSGYSYRQIRDRVASGQWRRVLGPVLCAGEQQVGGRLIHRAAQLAVPGSVLAASSAAPYHRLEVPQSRPTLIVDRRITCRVGDIRLIRDQLAPTDVWSMGGVLVTAPARTVLDCLLTLPERSALELLDTALQRRILLLPELGKMVRARAGRRGTPKLVRLVRAAASGSRSTAERRLAELLRRAGVVGWRANLEIQLPSGGVAVGDVVFPGARLVVEVDGFAFHRTPEQFQRDRVRQNALVAAGWTVLRFTWRDLTDHEAYVVAAIRRQLG